MLTCTSMSYGVAYGYWKPGTSSGCSAVFQIELLCALGRSGLSAVTIAGHEKARW